jgi:hypothetical protein
VGNTDEPVHQYIEEMLVWYDKAANRNQSWFYLVKSVQLVLAAAIPIFSLIPEMRSVQPMFSGISGAALIILEGLQQTFQFQQKWIQYRGTWSALKSEEFLFRTEAGPYKGASAGSAAFAERISELIASENKVWQSQQRDLKANPAA